MTINITTGGLMNVSVHVPTPDGKGRVGMELRFSPSSGGALIGALHKLVEDGLVSVERTAGPVIQ
jgi:hypothetical protein